jgi:hypothetical protein
LRLHNQGDKNRRARKTVKSYYASISSSSPIIVTLMMEAQPSSETSGLTRAVRRKIPEDGILHIHRRENLKSCVALTGWVR